MLNKRCQQAGDEDFSPQNYQGDFRSGEPFDQDFSAAFSRERSILKDEKTVNFGNMHQTKKKNGFTLVEVAVALSIMVVGMIGAYELVNQTITTTKSASIKLTAAYLGKEGIEIVKNIRDDNYLNMHYNNAGQWDDGLRQCQDGCGGDYTMLALDENLKDVPLKHDGNFFNYSIGNNTFYKRKITINSINNLGTDTMEVTVNVNWNERGRAYSLEIKENLYNWWPQ